MISNALPRLSLRLLLSLLKQKKSNLCLLFHLVSGCICNTFSLCCFASISDSDLFLFFFLCNVSIWKSHMQLAYWWLYNTHGTLQYLQG